MATDQRFDQEVGNPKDGVQFKRTGYGTCELINYGRCTITDKGMGVEQNIGGIRLEIDGTNHLDLIHARCGKRMELRVRTDYSKVDSGDRYKKLFMEVRCVRCRTRWHGWRKTVLRQKEGEFRPTPKEIQEADHP